MSNTLTSAQIATFDVFAAEVEEFLNNNSTEGKPIRHMDKKAFGEVWETASRPSRLYKVMNNITFFEANGRTKQQYQERTPEGTLCFRPDGSPVMSVRRCVMYTTEAYRTMRSEATGLKTPETTYAVNWNEVPESIQRRISTKFPKKSEGVPEFTPKALAIVLRKGNKVPKGHKRHSWAGFDFLVVGTYGDTPVVIVQAAVANKPYVAKLAKLVGIECPDWGQSTPQVKEELSLAASGLMARAVEMEDIIFSF